MKFNKITALLLCFIIFASLGALPAAADEEQTFEVISTTPEDGSTRIEPVGLTMEVTFNMPVDSETLSTATIVSEPSAVASVIPDAISANKCTIYFSALNTDTKYTVTFSKQIKAKDGTRLQKSQVGFKTTAKFPQYHQIVNSDMENPNYSGVYMLAGAARSSISFVKEGDNTVLKFTPAWSGAGVGQVVFLEPGKTYEMRAKIKSDSAQMVRMIMSYRTASGGSDDWWHPVITKNMTAGEWVEFGGSVTIPEDLSYEYTLETRITAQNINKTIYVDDWQFFESGFDVPKPQTSGTSDGGIYTFVSSGENEPMDRMTAFGIYDEDMRTRETELVTRLDAAKIFGRILGISTPDTNDNSCRDLSGIKGRGIVGSLVGMGIMSGYGEYFYPYNNISQDEALRGIASILGYDAMIAENGSDLVYARLKLNKGVAAADGGITFSDFAIIISNALDCEVMAWRGGGEYEIEKDSTLLYDSLELTEYTGVISATEYTGLYGEAAKEGYITIDGASYRVSCDAFGMEGKNVRYFVKREDGKNWIVYICDINTLNNFETLNWNDIESYENNKYTYWNENNKSRTIRTARNKSLIYNGAALSSYTDEDMVPAYGSVTLIDNNRDNHYDVVRVENFDTYTVNFVDYDNGIIYDKYENKSLNADLYEKLKIEENGVESSFRSITAGTVVSAAQSKDGGFTHLLISNNTLEGTMGAVTESAADTEIAIYDEIHGDGASIRFMLHPFYGGVKAIGDTNSLIGKSVKLSTDYFGRVAQIVIGNGDWQWAYLANAKLSTDRAFDPLMRLKVFTTAGKLEILNCADEVRVNGSKIKKPENILSSINGGADDVVPQLLRIKTNADNEIAEIISLAGDGTELKRTYSGSELTYSTAMMTLGGKAAVSSSTEIFSVPSLPAEAEEYQFTYSKAPAYLINEKKYTFDAYSSDDNDLTSEMIVVKNREVRNPDSWIVGVVDTITRRVDDNGDEYTRIVCRSASTNYNATVYDNRIDINNLNGAQTGTGLSLSEGDVVIYQNDSAYHAVNMRILYSRKNNTLYTSKNPSATVNASYKTIFGNVSEKDGSYIKVVPPGGSEDDGEIFNTALYGKLYGVDKDGKVYTATASDIYDVSCGENSSGIIAVSSWGGATLLVIYE